ncbi:ribosomal protein S18-alanine N-acetyltransferase [Candidatus Planktophila lacus]|jgi:ribosomal-protein-alanine N-acetyltransferase|uniref:[Ribosomal protein bS18]-alanine N-acetyltransferase n=1 Tax=Candidatus Planktophila lacus TaxID=1884913 RepID=A0AAD0E4Y1_9ACTN|nr:ribosomal protein S18-alanine N-acetyltransferase [Candidatus Planktophila lacus]ASY11000.1 ribosomal-protein-alanine N-acetyltransferase [Candidatus Planktophila lacus]
MISYRAAIQIDLPVLVSMERVLFADSPWTTGQFKEAFQGVPTIRHFLVATNEQDQIVGYAAVLVVAPGVEADVLTVAVLPEYARQGIATHFMGELEKWSKEKEASAMMLEVGVENSGAIALYEKLGYQTIATRKSYYGQGLDAFVMRKEFGA